MTPNAPRHPIETTSRIAAPAPTLLVVVVLCLFRAATANDQAAAPTIDIRDIPAARVIYKIEKGPYWQLGRAYAKVGDILAANPNAGPMFSRYLDDPRRVDPSELRTEVGFFAPAQFEAPPEFQSETTPAHRSATLTVKGPYATASQYHRRIRDWLASNGYTAAGEITEIYPAPTGPVHIVEIRVPITSEPADAHKNHSDQTAPVEPPETAPLDHLLQSKAYARAATRIVPPPAHLAAEHRAWLREITDRLRVIREIVDTGHADRSQDVHALLTPIVERASRIPRDHLDDASPTAIAPPFTLGNPTKRKNDALKSLDRLMVRAHLGKLTPVEILDQLVVTLTEIDAILNRFSIFETTEANDTGSP